MRFEDLEVWKRSARLSADIFRGLVDLKHYGFKDQITRSGLSIPSNIAEGYERNTERDRIKFLSYAKGSCGELRTQIFIGMDAGFVDPDNGRKWIKETRRISGMLYSLMKYFTDGERPAIRETAADRSP